MIRVHFQHSLGDTDFDIGFDAPRGITALFGASGAGKSTTLKAIAGLVTPNAGKVVLDDTVLFDAGAGVNLRPEARALGVVFQEPRLFTHMSVRENLSFGARFRRGGRLRLDDVAALLGLTDKLDQRAPTLSGGEAQRVAIGRALLSNPKALLLDEPLASLDQGRKGEILPYLEGLRDHLNMPMLFVSHDLNDVARLADQVILIDRGRSVHCGAVHDVLADAHMVPWIGMGQAGAVVTGALVQHGEDGLSELRCQGGTLVVPHVEGAVGTHYKLRLLAKDISLSLENPQRQSALNIWPAVVRDIHFGTGPGAVVALECRGDQILARVTKRSVQAMELTTGTPCFAILKSMAMAPAQVGAGRG